MGLVVLNIKNKGRGIFTDSNIEVGQTIEICPVVPISRKDIKTLKNTSLANYWYSWSRDMNSGQCLALGYGMLYNHSDIPNADFKANFLLNEIIFFSTKTILAREEITINYGVPLWFKNQERGLGLRTTNGSTAPVFQPVAPTGERLRTASTL